MSFAVRKDGEGWRRVDGSGPNPDPDILDWVYPDYETEDYSEALPADPVAGPELVLSRAKAERDRLLGVAAIRIAPLQDAADLDKATLEDVALLKKWKQYRMEVNRVTDKGGFPAQITWPNEPL